MDNLVEQTKSKMTKSVESFESELSTVRTCVASASILDRVEVMYYGFKTPLNQVASISVPEPRMLMVKPFDKSSIKDIEKAIVDSNLGLNPVNDGSVIRLPIPALTEERRKELCKQVSRLGEDAKVAIRNVRRDSNETVKKNKDVSEDVRKGVEEDIQKITDEFTKKVDELVKAKEKDLLTI
jgi:ribosome recycling factor